MQLSYWVTYRNLMRIFSYSNDPISPPLTESESTVTSLLIPELREVLHQSEIGGWAIDRSTIHFLWEKILQDRPQTILECGSGVSTLILAKYMSLNGVNPAVSKVFSLEQEAEIKCATEKRLAEYGLSDYVHIFYAPVTEDGKYQLNVEELQKQLGLAKLDWILIDGPAGPEGCRVWTLPLLAQSCRPGTKWFLHDAFRDGELAVLRAWSEEAGIIVNGIHPFGKGLGSGTVKDPEQVIKKDYNHFTL